MSDRITQLLDEIELTLSDRIGAQFEVETPRLIAALREAVKFNKAFPQFVNEVLFVNGSQDINAALKVYVEGFERDIAAILEGKKQ